MGNSNNKSILLGFIDAVLGKINKVKEVINQYFKVLIGDCQNTNFWNDNWMGRGQLCLCFLGIFMLGRLKIGPVKNFGIWVETRWRWETHLRR